MRCEIARLYLQDLLERRLSGKTAANLLEHLRGCPECEAELASWRELWTKLRDLAPCLVTPNMEARIVSSLASLAHLPKSLMLLFIVAGIITIAGLLSWVNGMEGHTDLVSAYLWAIAGSACVFSLWYAVGRSHGSDHTEQTREDKEDALVI